MEDHYDEWVDFCDANGYDVDDDDHRQDWEQIRETYVRLDQWYRGGC